MIKEHGTENDSQVEFKSPHEEIDKSKPLKDSERQFDIDVFTAWCKSCGICAAFCPKQCIRLDADGSVVVENPDCCTGCGWCELHCPDFAISVRPRRVKRTQEED